MANGKWFKKLCLEMILFWFRRYGGTRFDVKTGSSPFLKLRLVEWRWRLRRCLRGRGVRKFNKSGLMTGGEDGGGLGGSESRCRVRSRLKGENKIVGGKKMLYHTVIRGGGIYSV